SEACRVFFRKVLEVEWKFAQTLGLKQANSMYEKLSASLDRDKDAFPLRIGFGSGKLSVTLSLLEGQFNPRTRQLEPVDNNPKTRKTAGAVDPKDGCPLGWAIARLEPIQPS
ncbi:MAG: hypothetical protein NZ849_05995, partial [Meiothermus sp.]|nr:hypothetical protein [Meiothermus sp.]